MTDKKTYSVKLPDALRAQLAAAAREAGTSPSELLRRALAAYLRERAPRAGTFGELASDLCGAGSGPVDLSTADEWLDGYGR
jgi:hypothetical protein